MKTRVLLVLSALLFSMSLQSGFAAETNGVTAVTNDVHAKFMEIFASIQAKVNEHKQAESDYAADIKAFDDLLAKHPGEKSEDLAQVAFMRAQVYWEVLHNDARAKELFDQFKRDFPDSQFNLMLQQRDAQNAQMEEVLRQREQKRTEAGLVLGAKFPDFDEKDLNGKPLSVGNYKGKVVLVDFWATWCPPCVAEMPNILEVYKKHHADGLEIIGVSLDEDAAALKSFLEKKEIPWPQFFDGQHWQNKLAVKYGVMLVPSTVLVDREGKIIGLDLVGPALEDAVAKALEKK